MTKRLFVPAVSIIFNGDNRYHNKSKKIKVSLGIENEKKEIPVIKIQLVARDTNKILGRQCPTYSYDDWENVGIASRALFDYLDSNTNFYDEIKGFNGSDIILSTPEEIKKFD